MCCDATLEFVRGKFEFLIYFCILIGVLGIVNYTTLVALMTFLQIYLSRKLTHGLQEKVIAFMVGAIPVFTFFHIIVLLPAGPSYMPNLTVGEVNEIIKPTVIDERYSTFDGYFDIFDIIIREDRRSCGSACKDLDYLISLEVNKGILRLNPAYDKSSVQITQQTAIVNKDTKAQGYQLQFRGGLDYVNAALDLFEYKPQCPFDSDNTLSVKITAYPPEG